MTTSVGTQVHFDPADVGHKYKRGGHATLDFTGSGCTYLYLHFDTPAKIDAVIAELVALKQEMDPPAAGCPCVADAPDPEPLFPCCEHCIPACLAKPGYHAVACTTPGCPSAEAASVASVTA